MPLRLRMLTTPRLRPMFIVGMLLVFFQNFVGLNTIIYYAPTLLTNIGFGESGAILANVGIGAINMLVTIGALSLIDLLGRKPLLLAGAIEMTLGMVLLAVVNLLGQHGGTLLMGVTLLGIAIFIASFAVSWGPVPWVMLPAIFWLHIRAGAVGVCVIFIWLFNLIVALAFPSLLSALGAGPNFLFFAVMTALAFLFVKKLVPETKGRSLEAIERDLLHGASAPTGAT